MTAAQLLVLPVQCASAWYMVAAVAQLVTRPPTTSLIAVLGELVLLGVIIISTILYQSPQHAKLSSGFDPAAYRTLVRSNWVRAIASSVVGLLDLWLIAQAMPAV